MHMVSDINSNMADVRLPDFIFITSSYVCLPYASMQHPVLEETLPHILLNGAAGIVQARACWLSIYLEILISG